MKSKEIQSFQIYKITTEDIVNSLNENGEYDLYMSYSKAIRLGKIVSLGDNQVLMKIREKTQHPYNKHTLHNLYQTREQLRDAKSTSSSAQKLKEIERQILEQIFVPNLITVHSMNKGHYKEITRNGFSFNGIKFKRFASGSGQTRRNSPAFIQESIYDEIHQELLCGLGDRIKKINVAKFNAYYGLYMSSINKVPFPRFCIVSDNYITLKDEKVLWIDSIGDKHSVSEKDMDIEMNTHDGMGLCTPEYSYQMREYLGLDWDVNNWAIRGPYMKGLLVPFNFVKFGAEVAHTYIIKDLWGEEVDVRNVDVILTKSQFKMWKYFKSQKDLEEQIKKNDLSFGICRYNKKVDSEYSLLNYQYIQTLELEKEDIKELIQPTIDNIQRVCSGDKLYSYYFMLGLKNSGLGAEEIINSINTNFVKALLINDNVFDDPFVRKKIYKLVQRQIQLAKLGRVYTRGNYQTMIADPYALAEHIFGLEVKGILERKQVFSRWWLDRKVSVVDACRSPMVAQEEHNVMDVVTNDKAEEWFEYINSGIVYNIWDASTIIHSDSDFDFDIVFTTDNKIILDNIVEKVLPITYEKVSVPDQKFNYNQFIKADLKGFNTKIGSITNNSSIMFSMLPMFKGDDERESIIKERIHVLRKLIGNSIDAAKGVEYIPFPREWKVREKIEDGDSEEEKRRKRRHNSMIVSKKPYFMIEIYPKLKEQYSRHRRNFDTLSRIRFGTPLRELIWKEDKTDEEIIFLQRHNYTSPVLETACIMNILSKEVEKTNVDLKKMGEIGRKKEGEGAFDHTIYMTKEPMSDYIRDEIKSILKNMKKEYMKLLSIFREELDTVKEIGASLKQSVQLLFDETEKQIAEIVNNKKYTANYLISLAYEGRDEVAKNFLWTNFSREIVRALKAKMDAIEIPTLVSSEEGTNIFGQYVKLTKVIDEETLLASLNEESAFDMFENWEE